MGRCPVTAGSLRPAGRPPAAEDGHELDVIRLEGLRVKGFHGVLESERREGQDFVVDVALRLDTRPAAALDALDQTVDYGALAVGLADVVRGEPVNLLERLAQRLADRCLAEPRVVAVDVRVHKPDAPIPEDLADVSVGIRRTRQRPVDAVLSLGANLGEREATLRSAVARLQALDGVRITGLSAVVETEPVGGPDQGDYLNAVVRISTTLSPFVLLTACSQIELDHGRTRDLRWGPRALDIDIITYGDLVTSTPTLELPHPRAAERAFVLLPWAGLDPAAELPGVGRVADLAARIPQGQGVRPRPDVQLGAPAGS
jgi:dihydroneopterin aldolase/2-amino-4-hydroxy-6-hydroxymethyldihydropteridine diphosphokinase